MLENQNKTIIKIQVSEGKAQEWARKAKKLGMSRSEYLTSILKVKSEDGKL